MAGQCGQGSTWAGTLPLTPLTQGVWPVLVLQRWGAHSTSSLALAWLLAGKGVEAGTGWGGRGVRTHSMVFQITEPYCQSTAGMGLGWPRRTLMFWVG